eukprot:GHVU01031049.1.p1 GENE.GHVU01031049.1~~GHVU01031049.1.p1  ORF type:complete len:317 (-),score=74.53 GHVU01031049.1:125-1075(-)
MMDEACSSVRVQLDSKPEKLEILENQAFQLEVEREALGKETEGEDLPETMEKKKKVQAELERLDSMLLPLRYQYEVEKERISKLSTLNTKKESYMQQMKLAERDGQVARAAEIKHDILPGVCTAIQNLEDEYNNYLRNNTPLLTETVGAEQISEVVSRATGIPVHKLSESERDKFLSLEATLSKRVVGQEEAVASVCRAIMRNAAGLSKRELPVGSFLFLGPTGVGKTEVCKAVASEMFGSDKKCIVRFDMSEYMEEHSVAKLIGAPPGYVGHDDGGQLTEEIRRNPYSVVLLDEIEKAHPKVCSILLQVGPSVAN